MDKTILKNFAIDARNQLIEEIQNKAAMIGITEEGISSPLPNSTSDLLLFDIQALDPYMLKGKEISQYKRLVNELEQRELNADYDTAYETLIEEIAYTWFNRLIAIRFMEVNNYMPNRMRVLSSGINGVNEPELVTNYLDSGLDFNQEELEQLGDWRLDGNARSMDLMFQFLFIKQANALNENLPELFEKTDDYAELLLTVSYNNPEGVLYKLVQEVPEEYFDVETEDGYGQVEIIGWLYQYYNTEKKDEVVNVIKKRAIERHNIPAATQIFTTDWIVKYMVDNSLGKYWLERNPNSPIKDSLDFLIPGEIEQIDKQISPEDLKVFDNAMGSGHILSYAFDVLLKIYESEGYSLRDASRLIVEKNLYGLEIDKRAYQLAYFAVMMKARQYNRRALNGETKTNLAVFEDSTIIKQEHLHFLGQSMDSSRRKKALEQVEYLIKEFKNAKELGSILVLNEIDAELILEFIQDGPIEGQMTLEEINIEITQDQLLNILKITSLLKEKYEAVVTNPPYMNKFSTALKKYINVHYKDYNRDLFSVFIYRNLELTKLDGYSAYMTPNVWMFIKSYEKLRNHLINKKHIDSLIHLAKGSFYDIATVDVMTFVMKNKPSNNYGNYIRLEGFKPNMDIQKDKVLAAINNPDLSYYYKFSDKNYNKIPGSPIAFWVSEETINNYEHKKINDITEGITGLQTGNNREFLKIWYEVSYEKITWLESKPQNLNDVYWLPHAKGGSYRKWFGNYEYILYWKDNGQKIKEGTGARLNGYSDEDTFWRKGISWSHTSSSDFSARKLEYGVTTNVEAPSLKLDEYFEYIFGYLNTKVAQKHFNVTNATLHYLLSNVQNLPLIIDENYIDHIKEIVVNNASISKLDWNLFENSWDFKLHSLLDTDIQTDSVNIIEQSYENWKKHANSNFEQLKESEEKLNEIFIDIYGLEDELTPEVSDKNITITKIFDDKKDIYEDIKGNQYIQTKEDIVKSFISYAVGCMFGRYSLDEEGLIYAGGEWDQSKYEIYKPVEDNVLLITDEEYFEDDIVNRFIEFVKVVYGEETLEENLEFIADSLTGRGSSREKIRNYFMNNFYKDHCQQYSVRGAGKLPIYWMYDSSAGKTRRNSEDGFKALVYMHRYDEDTTGKVRMDYLHKVQRAYEQRIDNLEHQTDLMDSAREIADAEKEIEKLTKQLKELQDYDEKIGHLALSRIPIDLDDGIRVNYDKVQTDENGKKLKVLAKR